MNQSIVESRRVKTEFGEFHGFHCQNPQFTCFKGVPYAVPPVGKMRFHESVLPQYSDETIDCFIYKPGPVQSQTPEGSFYQKEFYPVKREFSEDCLYLNIWTPAKSANEHLPVMVWFHGGAYSGGCADEITFNGEAFAKRNVILVTVEYRVGIFSSFVSTQDNIYGNLGLKDQILALKWIKQSIENFGGDSSNITIFGQSAGGASVQSLMACEQANTLFAKAIIQSAGGINTLGGFRTLKFANQDYKMFLHKNNLSLQQIKKMPAEELQNIFYNYCVNEKAVNCYPNIDGVYLKDSPGNIINSGKIPDIPYMTGSVIGDEFFNIISCCSTFKEQEKQITKSLGKFSDAFKNTFLRNESQFDNEFLKSVALLNRIGSAEAFAKSRLKNNSKKPVFLYHFNNSLPGNDVKGYHSYDLWYVFGTLQHSRRQFVGKDYDISNQLTNYWSSFAAYGNPNRLSVRAPCWQAYTPDNPVSLEINDENIRLVKFSDNKIIDFMTDYALNTREL